MKGMPRQGGRAPPVTNCASLEVVLHSSTFFLGGAEVEGPQHSSLRGEWEGTNKQRRHNFKTITLPSPKIFWRWPKGLYCVLAVSSHPLPLLDTCHFQSSCMCQVLCQQHLTPVTTLWSRAFGSLYRQKLRNSLDSHGSQQKQQNWELAWKWMNINSPFRAHGTQEQGSIHQNNSQASLFLLYGWLPNFGGFFQIWIGSSFVLRATSPLHVSHCVEAGSQCIPENKLSNLGNRFPCLTCKKYGPPLPPPPPEAEHSEN
jgi:hypothetical protein